MPQGVSGRAGAGRVDCLTEAGIVWQTVARRPARACRAVARRFVSTRPPKEFRRDPPRPDRKRRLPSRHNSTSQPVFNILSKPDNDMRKPSQPMPQGVSGRAGAGRVDCLTEAGIVWQTVARRPARACRAVARRFVSTRPPKEFRRDPPRPDRKRRLPSRHNPLPSETSQSSSTAPIPERKRLPTEAGSLHIPFISEKNQILNRAMPTFVAGFSSNRLWKIRPLSL